jgi:hypothetical protein
VSADRSTRPEPRWLPEDQGLPGDFLVGFTRGLMDRREQLVGDGQPPEMARERAVGEAVQAFHAGAGQRGWTVEERRIASLAGDALGLEDEYRDRHGYEPELARLYAVGEVLESERLRGEIPVPWWREATRRSGPPPPASSINRPSGHVRADTSERTRPSGHVRAAGRPSGRGRPAMNADRPDPRLNGARGVRPDSHPDTPAFDPPRPVAGRVSTLDRVTLQLGVVVAVVIALCSYAVSATSLYALGRHAGYSWWQAAAVPVVADGPAIYGMFRIVSRSRRGAKGAGYGWFLVLAGTLASIGGNVAHAQPDLVAQAIAAAIPLAVLAMLEGLKGDAGEVTRLTANAAALDAPAGLDSPAAFGQPAAATSVHRADAPATLDAGRPDGPRVRELSARAVRTDSSGVRKRLQAAYAKGRPDGGAWTARTLADAAGCGRSTAAAFLQTQRTAEEDRS